MAGGASISINVLFSHIPAAPLLLRQRAGQISQQSAYRIRDDAKRRCPVDTGRLRDEIEAVKQGEFEWAVISPTPYARFVHYGTVHMAPRPYLQAAAEAERNTYLDAFDKILDLLT